MNTENPNFFASRHTERSFGSSPNPEYPGLTERGIEIAREQAQIILEIIQNASERGVIALCGVSEAIRTRSTAGVYTEAVQDAIAAQGIDCLVIDGTKLRFKDGPTAEMSRVSDIAQQRPNSKIFFSMPLFVKQFKIGDDRWQNEDGTWTSEYAEGLFKKANFEAKKVVEQIKLDYEAGVEGAMNPDDIAKDQLVGIKRLQQFIDKIFPDRDIIVGFVGHSPNLEILAQYLAHDRDADVVTAFPAAGIMQVNFNKNNEPNVKLPS